MFRSIADFKAIWKEESDATRELLARLSDASLPQPIDADHRTLGRLSWHLAQTIPEMLGKAGLETEGPRIEVPVPTSARAIADGYDAAAASVEKAIRASGWTDATLDETREMYGNTWTVGYTLLTFVLHQTHHRGQITVLMRQAGLPILGLYGPTKEDWAGWGMPAPEI